jgi:pilus assembly protein CpaF
MINLSLTEKGGPAKDLAFEKDELGIGRVRGNDIILAKGNVSKRHCRLTLRNGQIIIEDLHSTNGTYVNGRKIAEPTVVGPTDKIFVGDFIIRLAETTISTESHRLHPPEAGSLSTALPRRPPPPSPSVTYSDREDGINPVAKPRGVARSPLPTPPPPPPPGSSRDASDNPSNAEPFKSAVDPSFPTDINLDDEDPLSTPHPKLQVPPLKPAFQPSPTHSDGPFAGSPSDGLDRSLKPSKAMLDDSGPPEPSAEDASMDVVESQFPPNVDAGTAAKAKAGVAHRNIASEMRRSGGPRVSPEYPEWLSKLFDQDGVTAAFFIGTGQSEVLRHGKRESINVSPSDLNGLGAAVRKLTTKNPKLSNEPPIVNATLGDGMHIAALFPPAADRLCVAFNRALGIGKTIEDLVDDGVISQQMRQLLESCVASHRNIVVSGDRIACDSIIRVLTWSVDRVARVALLSEGITPPASATAWFKIQSNEDPTGLIAGIRALSPEYTIADAHMSHLLGVLLGECNLGLEGAIFSIVARSATDALNRLEVSGGGLGPSPYVRQLIESSIDVVVYARVLGGSKLKVLEIAEPKLMPDGKLVCNPLLNFQVNQTGKNAFSTTSNPSSLATKLRTSGYAVPDTVLKPVV